MRQRIVPTTIITDISPMNLIVSIRKANRCIQLKFSHAGTRLFDIYDDLTVDRNR